MKSRLSIGGLICVLATCAVWVMTASAQVPMTSSTPTGPEGISIAGKLPSALWVSYRSRFVTEAGRVVDTANKNISHSEGQGYGMLLAVAANDRATFDRIWNWTRANLMVRDDQLVAWRWEPDSRPGVADMNNASDGDILIAWALTEASDTWNDNSYRMAGRRIAVEVGRKVVLNQTRFGALLLPAVAGFSAEDRSDGPVVNLSYWVFPAFQRLAALAPDINWGALTQSGVALLRSARFGSSNLPTEWISMRGNEPRPAAQFDQTFAYNNIRIPLYLAWAGLGTREDYQPFVAAWSGGTPAVVDTNTGRRTEVMDEPGYAAIVALTNCAANQREWPQQLRTSNATGNYYPATLHLLALIAAQSRYPACLRAS